MTSKRQTISVIGPKSETSREATGGSAKLSKVLAGEDLETRVLQVLEKHNERGLTCGELSKKCRPDWRRGLAAKLRLKKAEAGLNDVQSFIYDLWTRGLVFSEPPGRGKKASRFWAMDTARAKFPLVFPLPTAESSTVRLPSREVLKSAYDKFVPEHLGGFVPIFKVRRELVASRQDFDDLLRSLSERDEPILELLGGDPQKYTADQRKDSFWRGDNLYLRMRWRET